MIFHVFSVFMQRPDIEELKMQTLGPQGLDSNPVLSPTVVYP